MGNSTMQGKERENEKTDRFPLAPSQQWIQFQKEHMGMEIEQVMRSQAMRSVFQVCEMRDSAETPAPVKLQACSLILNKVLPDKIGPRLDVQVDLVKLFEMYRSMSNGKDQSSQGDSDK